MVIIYLLLILIATELTGFYLLQSLERYYLSTFSTNLGSQAQFFAGSVSRYLLRDKPDAGNIRSLVADFSSQFGVEVTVLNGSGVVLASSASHLAPSPVEKRLVQDEITRALGGTRGETIRTDPESGERRLYVAVPVLSGPRVTGVVYLSSSLERTYRTLGDIRRYILYSTLLALGVTAVVGYVMARTITGPIREITSRAADMAAGNFEQKIRIRSEDEIGQLGAMFNYLTLKLKETLGEISDEKGRVEAIITYMVDGLLALDKRGLITLVNPAAAAMLGVKREEVMGKDPATVLPAPDLQVLLGEVLRDGQTVSREFTVQTLSPKVLKVDFAPLRGESGNVTGIVIVLHDITEQDKLDRLRREFVANVSHELRTPITTVKSYVETLLDGALEEPGVGRRFLGVVESETNRMARLVTDLLRLSQLDSRQATWDFEPVDLRATIEDVLSRLEVQAEKKGIRILREWPPELPLAVADRDKIQQVLINLLTNAIEFTPPGGTISVALGESGGRVRTAIRDTGIGIPKDDLPRIFERFYRVDKARSRELGGTGLGLAIAKEIVGHHGGEIEIRSEFGRGTEVTFTLPIAEEVDS